MATAKKTAKKKPAPKKKIPVKKTAPKKKAVAKKKEIVVSAKPVAGSSSLRKFAGSKNALSPLGKKFTCHTCGTKFYDLNKEEKLCPKCGADQNKKPVVKSRSARPRIEEEEFLEDNIAEEDAEVGFEDEETIVEEPLEEEEDEEEEEE
ncbi:TIGR02300 family protein [Leptospira fluminis]|uniref:TIGR02300 family protein n=1 Tax=Leptospira fluminis TaxID=2484979 RepID=A0A4R9GSZ6_9LEPT|nr:TIGR02300 family protein [Leptospira fluminis]TGK21928.1 TIGR02300 family protein [Leptospira fluminis]